MAKPAIPGHDPDAAVGLDRIVAESQFVTMAAALPGNPRLKTVWLDAERLVRRKLRHLCHDFGNAFRFDLAVLL